MKKQPIKIILGTIIFVFAIFFIQAILPLQASAATTKGLDWNNPNSSSSNSPFKFKASDYLNSEMVTTVVGCTGITDKITNAFVNFSQDLLTSQGRQLIKAKVCNVGIKLGIISGVALDKAGVSGNEEIPKALEKYCNNTYLTTNTLGDEFLRQATQKLDIINKRDECFNGIAVTLAKNQLTAMTRYTMNWVNSGFNGDPMYVQNITSFTNSMEKNVIETGVSILSDKARPFPYGADFSRSAILGYNSGASFRSGATNFLNSLTSDLGNFITDPKSYYSDNALDRANSVNNTFANDFSTGGWNGWLALTQKDQNNPLGFTMKASEFLQDQQTTQTQNNKDEIATNGGFLSQKECILWDLYDESGPIYKIATSDVAEFTIETSKTKKSEFDKCDPQGWKTITPGSIIKDKVSTYLTSDTRQTELVKTINDSLNSIFGSILSNLALGGLSSLSSTNDTFNSTNTVSGYGSTNNYLVGNDYIDLKGLGLDNPTDSTGGSGYTNGSFDLTRDLGNTFIHSYNKIGSSTWDALNNKLIGGGVGLKGKELKMGTAPTDINGTPFGANVYYVVSTAGHTELVDNGANNWEVGDRAFWNGSEWQNWKKGESNPIKKRGVLQIQKDYIVAAKQLLMTLPTVMPKIGELDYCIPGPNPNWQTNAGEAEAAFTDLVGATAKRQSTKWVCPADHSVGIGRWRVKTEWFVPIPNTHNCWWFTALTFPGIFGYKAMSAVPDKVVYAFPLPGKETYDNYYNIFKDTMLDWWDEITTSDLWVKLNSIAESQGDEGDQKVIDESVREVTASIKSFYTKYSYNFDSLYGTKGLMQKQYLENENNTTLTPNPSYLPMASEGLDITKDIVSYNDDITQTTADYNNAIIKANANINKLEAIKTQVSAIIQAAQKRRDDKVLASADAAGLTKDQYLQKYKSCFDEENISFFEDLTISNAEAGARCYDNMDNDLDGLVDSKDPDCHVNGDIGQPLLPNPNASN